MTEPARNVSEYLKAQPKDVKAALEKLRNTIKSAAPKAEESINYRLPFYRYKGHLLAFVNTGKHLSLVTMSYKIVKDLKDELKPYKISGTTIQFQPAKPLSPALVKKIVKARIKENETAEKTKQLKSKSKAAKSK